MAYPIGYLKEGLVCVLGAFDPILFFIPDWVPPILFLISAFRNELSCWKEHLRLVKYYLLSLAWPNPERGLHEHLVSLSL